MEHRKDFVDRLIAQNGSMLIRWLLHQIRRKRFDANKLYASEILSMVLQTCRSARSLLGDLDSSEGLVIAGKHFFLPQTQPKDSVEAEYVENVFASLCSVIDESTIRREFFEGEGLQLLFRVMRERMSGYRSSLRTLAHATSGAEVCAKFVQLGGLKVLFKHLWDSVRST